MISDIIHEYRSKEAFVCERLPKAALRYQNYVWTRLSYGSKTEAILRHALNRCPSVWVFQLHFLFRGKPAWVHKHPTSFCKFLHYYSHYLQPTKSTSRGSQASKPMSTTLWVPLWINLTLCPPWCLWWNPPFLESILEIRMHSDTWVRFPPINMALKYLELFQRPSFTFLVPALLHHYLFHCDSLIVV